MVQRGGLWINFSAVEGAGKGTQIGLAKKYLESQGYAVSTGREPGGTDAGEAMRVILQNPHPNSPRLCYRAETIGFVFAGTQFYEELVRPAREKNEIFISDRWRWDTVAYQGFGLGEPIDVIETLTKYSCEGDSPDITFIIDIDPALGLSKITGREFGDYKKDRIEARRLEFFERAREGFLYLVKKYPEKLHLIPYIENNPQAMHAQIIEIVDTHIALHGLDAILRRT